MEPSDRERLAHETKQDDWIAKDAAGRERQRTHIQNVLCRAAAEGLAEDNPVLVALREKLHRLGN